MNLKHQTQAIEKQAQAIREIREEMVSELNELEGMNVKTTYIGQRKVIEVQNRAYPYNEENAKSALDIEWAEKVLSEPEVVYQNGRNSHDVAFEAREAAELDLLGKELYRVTEKGLTSSIR